MISVLAVSAWNPNQGVKKIFEATYNQIIFDKSKAKFVGTETPFFLTFINSEEHTSVQVAQHLIKLGDDLEGKVQVGVSDIKDEKLSMAYDVTTDLRDGPISFYIDTDG